ncbi:MAG: hypothetical protein V1925_04665 [Candidatus Omnitrophota bacterium]
MKFRIVLILAMSCFCLLSFTSTAGANLKRYTQSYDIAEVEWQLLNWTAAWRNTTTPAKPFILERMEYSRQTRKISIYLKGEASMDTQDNLDKSIEGIVSLFAGRFPPDFDQATDITVYYELESEEEGQKPVYIEYNNSSFSRQKSESPSVKVKVPY